jgi:hypothetical protein
LELWNKFRSKWTDVNEIALNIATDIVNTQVRLSYLQTSQNWGIFERDHEVQSRVKTKLHQHVENQMRRLLDMLTQLVSCW